MMINNGCSTIKILISAAKVISHVYSLCKIKYAYLGIIKVGNE